MSRFLPEKLSQSTSTRSYHIWIGIHARCQGLYNIGFKSPDCKSPSKIWYPRTLCL